MSHGLPRSCTWPLELGASAANWLPQQSAKASGLPGSATQAQGAMHGRVLPPAARGKAHAQAWGAIKANQTSPHTGNQSQGQKDATELAGQCRCLQVRKRLAKRAMIQLPQEAKNPREPDLTLTKARVAEPPNQERLRRMRTGKSGQLSRVSLESLKEHTKGLTV